MLYRSAWNHPTLTAVLVVFLILGAVFLFATQNADFGYNDKNNDKRISIGEVTDVRLKLYGTSTAYWLTTVGSGIMLVLGLRLLWDRYWSAKHKKYGLPVKLERQSVTQTATRADYA